MKTYLIDVFLQHAEQSRRSHQSGPYRNFFLQVDFWILFVWLICIISTQSEEQDTTLNNFQELFLKAFWKQYLQPLRQLSEFQVEEFLFVHHIFIQLHFTQLRQSLTSTISCCENIPSIEHFNHLQKKVEITNSINFD